MIFEKNVFEAVIKTRNFKRCVYDRYTKTSEETYSILVIANNLEMVINKINEHFQYHDEFEILSINTSEQLILK